MWCNLDIANMNFEEWCDEAQGRDEHGFWQAGERIGKTPESVREEREQAIKALIEEGKA